MRYLVTDAEFDANTVDKSTNQSLLYKIVMFNSTKCLQALTECHKNQEITVDCDIKDYRGFAPLHLSIVKNQISVLKILHRDLDANIDIKTKNGVCPILLAIKSSKTDIMK
mmetsp:Transcript_35522/g.29896  ORF Transcript_35522/g.29896 Transcript_35522/m.29896 type:complete len:111 (+) Transcript_35522:620-952(+)